MNKHETLMQNGFYVGKIEELVPDMTEFNRLSDMVVDYPHTMEGWDCFYPLRDDKPNGIQFHENQEKWPSIIPMKDVAARDELIKAEGYSYDQKWYRMLYDPAPIQPIKERYFRSLALNLVRDAYPEISLDTVRHNDCFAMYDDKGCYIKRHKDGQRGKFCGLIIYMSREEDWNDGGGEFWCGTDTNANPVSEKISPIRGNYVVLDFTRHDAWHEVLPVKNGFKRWSYLDFIRSEP